MIKFILNQLLIAANKRPIIFVIYSNCPKISTVLLHALAQYLCLFGKLIRMKKILFTVVLSAGLLLGASAQEKLKDKDVPTSVQTSFKSEFPNAKDVEWKMKEGKYKVSFEVNGLDHIAAFGTDGKLISKGMKIRESELPAAIATAVKGAYADRTIDDVYRVDKNGSAHYLVKLNGDPETKVLYSADGQVVKEKMDQ
jgi:hypothetical protein